MYDIALMIVELKLYKIRIISIENVIVKIDKIIFVANDELESNVRLGLSKFIKKLYLISLFFIVREKIRI